jgi:hypothetical protein
MWVKVSRRWYGVLNVAACGPALLALQRGANTLNLFLRLSYCVDPGMFIACRLIVPPQTNELPQVVRV